MGAKFLTIREVSYKYEKGELKWTYDIGFGLKRSVRSHKNKNKI